MADANPELFRKYKISDSGLSIKADQVVVLIERDAEELVTYGITSEIQGAAITLKSEEFQNFPTDEEKEGEQIEETGIKIREEKELKNAIRDIMAKVAQKWPVNYARYRSFGTKGLDKFNETAIYFCGKRVVRRATLYLNELLLVGVTQDEIDNLETINQTYHDNLINQSEAIYDRDISKEKRIILGNALYKMVVKVCDAGKKCWHGVSEAKYNDYVIYDEPTPVVIPPVVP